MRRKWLIGVAALLAVLLALFLAGPRVDTDTTITFDPASIGTDVEAYLAAREGAVPNIREGLAKEVIWADPQTKAKTPLAIVYIHGFSASKGEVKPLPEIVARTLGANLFYTRLTGHGQDSAAMGTASVNAWLNDGAEALAVGRAIGERVLVMATSTGGGIATWVLAQPELSENVAGVAFFSPNFAIQASGAWILTMPWGGAIAELVSGEMRGTASDNPLVERYWTTRHPTSATLPLAAITKMARETDVGAIKVPALFVLSDRDQVVQPAVTGEIAARWGGPNEIVAVTDSTDPGQHVLAGDARSPGTTQALAQAVVDWAKRLP